MPTKEEKTFACLECGTTYTPSEAGKVLHGDKGCRKCGGFDLDLRVGGGAPAQSEGLLELHDVPARKGSKRSAEFQVRRKAKEEERPATPTIAEQERARNREEWLSRAVLALAPILAEKQLTVPAKVMVTCGWTRKGGNRVGECWSPEVTADSTTHLFISPVLGDAVKVLDTLIHELVHACVGVKEGHRGAFARAARAIGLEGKMTSTVAGKELRAKLVAAAEALGPYPHSAITDRNNGRTPAKGEFLSLVSVNNEEYKIKMIKAEFVKEHGYPRDPWGDEMVPVKNNSVKEN